MRANRTGRNRNFVVLGGVGAIGRVVVRDLFESHPRNHIVVADYNAEAARCHARRFHSRRVTAVFADARQPKQLAGVFRGNTVVINCTQHDFNLQVMQAALAAKLHYVDLGGLFYWTRRQLKLDPGFRRAGLTAVLGMGCSPGITNVMTRAGVEKLTRVDSVRIRVGSKDFNGQPADFFFPYSAQTIVEELTLRPWVFESGRFHQVNPRTGWERVRFPRPVGTKWVVRTRHSEVATIPGSFAYAGLSHCDFAVSFDRGFVREVVKRLANGWTAREFARLPTPRAKPNDYEVSRVIASDKRRTICVDCHARANRRWHASAGDVDTGCPPSIVAQMIASGVITKRGVLAPEVAVPVIPFFRELRRRRMRIEIRESKA
ncbi:MAG TPA: saccharopine dehydrogenase NADP-binding domain-containing protein [Verrucomicrobiae bacterium]|nr:saccharopine dehydrogenase NADP-binding domain-containing protein [Verrucomicrobiae bacterium]